MNMEQHIAEFINALNGGRGSLDAWLECNNEQECRDAINGAIAKAGEIMRERCADSAQAEMDEQYIDSSPWYAAKACRDAISALPGVTIEDLK